MKLAFFYRALAWSAAGLLSLGALASQAQTSNLPAPTGSASNTIAQASGSNVVVDLTKRQGYNVPATLFGVSCGHLTTDGAPYDYHSLNNSAQRAAIQSMSFGLVRLNWDLNTTMDYIFGGSSVSFASVDNFINNASLFGLPGKPLIITIGWPSSMTDEFRYGTPSAKTLATYQDECRQVAAYFKSKGLSGIYWGLANEVHPYPMANLVAIFNAMQAGIYQADGTAQCGGITDEWRDDGRLVSFVQGANPKPKFLDWHGYLGNISDTDDALIARVIATGNGFDKLRTDLANAGFARNLPMGNTEFNVNADWQDNDVRNGNSFACMFAAILFHQQITNDHAAVFAAPWELGLDSTFGMIDGSGVVQPLGKFITRAAQALPGEACAASVGTSLSNLFVLPTVNGSTFGCMVTNASSSDQTVSLTINGLPGSSYSKTEHSPAHPNGLASTVTASSGSVVSMTLPAKSVCVLSGSGTVVTPPPPPTTTDIVSGATYQLRARHSGKVLDVAGGGAADGTTVQQWTAYDNNPNQQWVVTLQDDGSYILTHQGTNEVLDVADGSTADGATVQQWTATDNNPNQRWVITATDNGYYKLLHQGTTKCLEVASGPSYTNDGQRVQQWEYVGGTSNTNQQWQFVRLDQVSAATKAALASSGATPTSHRELSVYPNPATAGQFRVNLSLTQAGPVQLQLFDVLGRVVRTQTRTAGVGAQVLPVDAHGLPAGLYQLRVQAPGGGAALTQKVVLQ